MFGLDELRDMIEKDNGAEVVCEFCGELCQATQKDLKQLIQYLQQPSTEMPIGQLRRS